MVAVFSFVLYHYILLAVFGVAVFGLGRPLAGWMASYPQLPALYRWSLQVTAGAGVAIVLLFLAGVLGVFNSGVILGLVLSGWVMAVATLTRFPSPGRTVAACKGLVARWRGTTPAQRCGVVALLLLFLPLLGKPLQTPHEWDELMYHLPYARFWAEQGSLAVNEWLRYPLSAYNMNLLYSGALLVGSDLLTHLLHMFFGLLAASLTFVAGRFFLDWKVGLGAGLLVVFTGLWGYDNAYVDLGLMAFWAGAFASLALRYQYRDARYALLAAALAGIAVGIKYQGLFYLPEFAVLALVLERRFRVVVCAILVFAVTGGYWYLRNYLLSGDPVHPVGGPVFGFWLWDAGDLASQFDDIGRAALWRHWVYLPALLAVFLWRQSSPFLRGLVVCAAASLLIWYAGSAYWRYAVPIYPMLALLTAWVGTQLWPVTASAILWRRLPRGAGVALLLVLLLASGLQLAKELSRLHPDGESRARYLVAEHAGHALLASLPELPGRVLYQLGFEDQIYYLPSATIGDWFGPARYADVMALSGDAQALARHLEQLGADMLLVNLRRAEFPTFDDNPGMEEHFQLLARSDQAALYLRVGPRERGPVSVQGVTGK